MKKQASIEITLFNEKDDSMLKGLPNQADINLFQSLNFYRFLQKSNHFTPSFFLAKKEGRLIGSLLCAIQHFGKRKHFFSSRAIIYGGPVVFKPDDQEEVIQLLLQETKSCLSRKCLFFEIRNFEPQNALIQTFSNQAFKYSGHLNFLLDLDAFREDGITMFSPARRREVEKSLAKGVKIVDEVSEERIKAFHQILRDIYQTKARKPLPPLSFFCLVARESFAKMLFVLHQGKVVGAVLLLHDNKQNIYQWYLAGDQTCQENVYPSTMATYSGIDYAARNGYQTYDFMGAGKPGKPYGVRDFKKQFGGKLVNYGRYSRINYKFLYFLGMKLLPCFSKWKVIKTK